MNQRKEILCIAISICALMMSTAKAVTLEELTDHASVTQDIVHRAERILAIQNLDLSQGANVRLASRFLNDVGDAQKILESVATNEFMTLPNRGEDLSGEHYNLLYVALGLTKRLADQHIIRALDAIEQVSYVPLSQRLSSALNTTITKVHAAAKWHIEELERLGYKDDSLTNDLRTYKTALEEKINSTAAALNKT